MNERLITISGVEPLEIFGAGNENFRHIRDHFPKLKVIARGDQVKIIGDELELDRFEGLFDQLLKHTKRYRGLSKQSISGILNNSAPNEVVGKDDPSVLVHGNSGVRIRARTENQQKMVASADANDMVFAVGPAGSGKTYTAVALAVRSLKNKEVRRIILTRPAVEAGENLGFLPGDLQEKLDPYLRPLYDALYDMIPRTKLNEFLVDGTIEIAPLAFMRGRTLDNAFVILDEAQNATLPQLKMFLTRMGRSAKFVITGDVTQVDLPTHQPSGLPKVVDMLDDTPGIAIVRLSAKDVIRHELVVRVLEAFDRVENK